MCALLAPAEISLLITVLYAVGLLEVDRRVTRRPFV